MATNDEIRLKMTVSKMNIHRSTKLETIAAKCIVRNLDSFLDPKNSETRNVKLLPSDLRNIVLQQWLIQQSARSHDNNCIKIFEKRMEVIQSMVSCHTFEVDLTPFMDNRPIYFVREHLLRYLDVIGAKATNLKVLTLSAFNPHKNNLNGTVCEAISKFRKLTSLNMQNIYVNYTNLKALCKNLESLTHLSTRIIFNPNFDESNQREIEDLQIFSNLVVFETGAIDEKFTLNCIQRLPKLQCFGYLGFPLLSNSTMEELLDRCPNQKFALTRLKYSTWSNKEIHQSFPDVTHLKVHRHDIDGFLDLNALPRFSKIENLTLSDFQLVDKAMIPFLDAYGQGLLSLRINNCNGQLKLSSILERCPKLQSLRLEGVSILPECSSRPEIHSFSTGLKEFEWKHSGFGNDENAPLLSDILSVPTLERVTLRLGCNRFHLEDIEKLTAMIASRQILGNLKRLKIIVMNVERDTFHRLIRVLSNFIKSASAFLPLLTEIETNVPSIPSYVQVEINSEASLEVIATLQKFIDVYEN